MSFPASNNVNASGFRFLATKANCRPDCSTLPVEEDHCNHRPSSLSQTREICFSSDRSRQLCQMSTRWTRRSWAFEARGLESRRYNNTQLGQWGKNGDLKGKSKGSPFISEPRSIDRWNVWKGLLAKKDRLCYKCFLCASQCVQPRKILVRWTIHKFLWEGRCSIRISVRNSPLFVVLLWSIDVSHR